MAEIGGTGNLVRKVAGMKGCMCLGCLGSLG